MKIALDPYMHRPVPLIELSRFSLISKGAAT